MTFRYLSLAMLLFASTAHAETAGPFDWPQWQGANRNAVSQEQGLLQEWPEGGPQLVWKITGLGGGDSAPSIANGRMYGMSFRGDQEVVWALSEENGQEVWATPLGPAFEQRMPQSKEGPGCTPTVDGDRVYVIGMGGSVACLQAADGRIVWQRSFTADFGGQVPTWSYRESPLVDANRVICTPGGPEATMVALDKLTGETIWQSKLPEAAAITPAPEQNPGGRRRRFGGSNSGAAYASAIAIDVDGQRQYVQLTSKTLMGVAAEDGKFLWRYDAPANGMAINCSTPLFHDGVVFAASAYGAGGGAVRLAKDASGAFAPEEVYFSKRMQNHHGGMVVVDGCLYGANGGNEGGSLTCLDFATGEVLWDERSKRRAAKGAIAFADGRLYYREEDGTLLLVEPSREEYLERGRFEQPERSDSPAWSHPVIANGKLYIRDQDLLLCYDIKR